MPETLQTLFKSRRFWAIVAGIVLVVAKEPVAKLGLTPEDVTKVVLLIGTWVAGETLRSSNATPVEPVTPSDKAGA